MPTYTPQDVKRIRKRLHLTQQELANLLGCSKQTVSYWEQGRRNLSGTARTALTILTKQPPENDHIQQHSSKKMEK